VWCGIFSVLFLYVLGVLGVGVLVLKGWESVFCDVDLLEGCVCDDG
jgi:hypothetical protein